MIISFFEEFPTKRNLDKLKSIKFPTKLYLGAKSLDEFLKLKSRIKNKHIKEFVYWPILEVKEGYWISPFSQRKALKRIFNELGSKKVSVMLDLELPTTKNFMLFFTEILNFYKNKHLIKRFIRKHPGKVYLAEYYPEGRIREKTLWLLGLHFKKAKVIKMVYHSMHDFDKDFIKKELKAGRKKYGKDFLVAYGTIARGISRKEPILTLKQLEEDLKIAREARVKEVVIYRLGGLNKKCLEVVKNF
jgi:hypothetical protein